MNEHPWKLTVDAAVKILLERRQRLLDFTLMTGRPPLSVLLTPKEKLDRFMDPTIGPQMVQDALAEDQVAAAKLVDDMTARMRRHEQ